MPSFTRVAVAVAPLLLAVRADLSDFEIDSDVPNQCRDVCRPVADLSSRCEVDLNDNDVGPGQSDDHWEDLLEAQCVCTNDSFDVGRISGLCASCIQQNMNNNDDDDDDDMEDINSIMRICGFSSTSYASADSTAARGITVDVTRPTATSELTTTITGGTRSDVTMTSTGSGPSNTGNSNSNDDNNDNNNNNNNDGNDNSNNDDDSLAARNALPGMALGIAAAAVGASMLLL